ncbi:MAG TPA: HigA family addiction module antitoxin [Candidatus Hydrogenedentes bacterium]|nr:HigA family addiction module antitoxin [Candidatus Hydrogenedentota bacterium]HQM51317.1 HigA family addiction module antitoxin [Candidatus Hydrogenedentota bacterium]
MAEMRKDRGYAPDIAIPPGETLLESIKALGMSQTELAQRMGRPLKTINEIIKGKTAITPQTAMELERVVGAPARFWLRLEMDYQEALARLDERKALEEDKPLLKRFPYTEMAKKGWLASTRSWEEKIRLLRAFLGVATLDTLPNVEAVAYRKAQKVKASPEALSVWLRRGELLAQEMDTAPFSKAGFREALKKIRRLTRGPLKTAIEKTVELCAANGVAVVFVPHLPNTYVNGAARWVKTDKALIQLSIRYRFEDVFWFTFFHESGHILLHGTKGFFIDVEKDARSEEERQADEFARDMLIPQADFRRFTNCSRFDAASVKALAKEVKVCDAVVIGRLQHEQQVPYRSALNDLKRTLDWEKHIPEMPFSDAS